MRKIFTLAQFVGIVLLASSCTDPGRLPDAVVVAKDAAAAKALSEMDAETVKALSGLSASQIKELVSANDITGKVIEAVAVGKQVAGVDEKIKELLELLPKIKLMSAAKVYEFRESEVYKLNCLAKGEKFDGSIHIGGNIVSDGGLESKGGAKISGGGGLEINAPSKFNGAFEIAAGNPIELRGLVNVTQNARFIGGLAIGANQHLTMEAGTGAIVKTGGDLVIVAPNTIQLKSNNFSVTGDTTLGKKLAVNDETTLHYTLNARNIKAADIWQNNLCKNDGSSPIKNSDLLKLEQLCLMDILGATRLGNALSMPAVGGTPINLGTW